MKVIRPRNGTFLFATTITVAFFIGYEVLVKRFAGFIPNQCICDDVTNEKTTQLRRAVFAEGHPKLLLLITYERAGSSFVGDLIGEELSVYYVYEPLAGIYSNMYGSDAMWITPAEISIYDNGSSRVRPKREADAVNETLKLISDCDLYSLPLDMIMKIDRRYEIRKTTFTECIWSVYKKHKQVPGACMKRIRKYCPMRFGNNTEKIENCRLKLEAARSGKINDVITSDREEQTAFTSYVSCAEEYRKRLADCLKPLVTECEMAKIRLIKTIRARMEDVEWLLNNNPNCRVIHLIRDPRGVIASRLHIKWARSIYTLRRGSEAAREEGHIYCNDVIRDIRMRRYLEEKYPGKILEVVYDHLMEEPDKVLERLRQFLNESLPLANNLLQDSNHKPHTQWESNLKYANISAIDNECETLYNLLPNYWPKFVKLPPKLPIV